MDADFTAKWALFNIGEPSANLFDDLEAAN